MIILSSGSLYTYGLARVFNMAAATGFDGMEVIIDRRKVTRSAADLDRHWFNRLEQQSSFSLFLYLRPFLFTFMTIFSRPKVAPILSSNAASASTAVYNI